MHSNQSILSESLFEQLAGQFADGTPINSVPKEARRAKSIADHLWRMFNTRQGALPHLPDYGLPDIGEIYRKLPGSLKELELTLMRLTARYEPRLERVRIRSIPTAPQEFRLSFELAGVIKGGERVIFQTSFSAAGETRIHTCKPRD